MNSERIWEYGRVIGFGIGPLLLIAVLTLVFHYLDHALFFSAVEIMAAGVSCAMFIIALNTYRISYNNFFAFLGLAFGLVGLMGLMHALSAYDFVEHKLLLASFNQQLGVASRLVESISLITSFFFLRRNIKLPAIFLAYALLLVVISVLVVWADTSLLNKADWVNVFLLGSAVLLLFKNRGRMAGVVFRFMCLALVTAIGCDLIQVNTTVESNAFMVARVLNFLSFYFLYKALVEATLQMPYQTLFHDLCSANSELKRELSGREKAEIALKSSESKYRAVVNSLPDLLFRMMNDGTIVEIIPTKQFAARIFPGHERRNIHGVLPEAVAAKYVAMAREALADNEVKVFEYRLDVDGARCDREARLFSSGENEVLVLVRDMSERQLAEQRLRQSEKRYRSLLAQSSDGIFTFDPVTGRVEEANSRFLAMLGYSTAEIKKLTLEDIKVTKGVDALAEYRQQLCDNQTISGLREYRTKSGSVLFVEISASMVLVDERLTVMVNVRDVTESRRRQDALQHDFRLAASVQRSFLPPPVATDRVRIETIFAPVHLVSGDLYGYKWKKNGCILSGFLFDVMGHGLATTLMTSALMVLFSQAFESDLSLREKMAWVNAESMRYFNDDSFAAALCFEIDLNSMSLIYVAGGITGFLASLSQASGRIVCEGSLIGIDKEAAYEEKTVQLSAGDNIFFITDGLQDLLLPDEELDLRIFASSVAWLRRLSNSAGRRDDCAALCIAIN